MMIVRILLAAAVLVLAACGTSTPLQRGDDTSRQLASYTRAVVVPLADATKLEIDADSEPELAVDQDEIEGYRREVATAGRAFADALAAELRQRNEFSEVVVDEPAQPGDLVIGGEVTKLVTGNFAMRWAIGITGAGRSGFVATVRLSDARSGEELGTLMAEGRSSRLGGALAAIQSAEVLARDAAFKAAVEIGKARKAER